jgi:uncharacterized protein YjbI with pentapeptide repeats
MQGSSLKFGKFGGATMLGVNLRNASMQGINLKGAQLGGTPGAGSRRRNSVPGETILDGSNWEGGYVFVTMYDSQGEFIAESELFLDTDRATPTQIKVQFARYLGM